MRETPMSNHPRIMAWPLALVASIALALATGEARANAGPVGKWLGQDGHDLVGGNPGPSKNGYQDIHVAIKGLPANHELAKVEIRGFGSGAWASTVNNQSTVLIVRQPRSTSADLYFEPDRREVGRSFDITLKL